MDAFRQALQTRSTDYSLWNKLGATLANSGRSSEAIDAYQKALELKPNYMRAWVNMGISQASLPCHQQFALRIHCTNLSLVAAYLRPKELQKTWAEFWEIITPTGRLAFQPDKQGQRA